MDTSAWIDAVQIYNPASPLFEALWRFIEEQIRAGHVVSPWAVHEELKEKTLKDAPAFADFVKRNKGRLFADDTKELQERVTAIVNRYPDLTKKGKPFARSDADAWVIALAEERGAIVVAQEKPKPLAKVPWKIPDVARAQGVRTIPLHEFVDGIQGLSAEPSQEGATDPDSEPDPGP